MAIRVYRIIIVLSMIILCSCGNKYNAVATVIQDDGEFNREASEEVGVIIDLHSTDGGEFTYYDVYLNDELLLQQRCSSAYKQPGMHRKIYHNYYDISGEGEVRFVANDEDSSEIIIDFDDYDFVVLYVIYDGEKIIINDDYDNRDDYGYI